MVKKVKYRLETKIEWYMDFKKCLVGLILLLCFSITSIEAQDRNDIFTLKEISSSKLIKTGKTKAIRDMVPVGTSNIVKKDLYKPNWKAPANFSNRMKNRALAPEMEHSGPDPIRQKHYNSNKSLTVDPIVNIDGITSGSSPNDPSGDIGKSHYVQMVNVTDIAVYDKTGNLVITFAANVIWSSIGFSSAGDPIVLYDQEHDKWILTEFANQGNNLLFAVSEGSDPSGVWTTYNFSTPNFPDYPKYAIWDDVITITTNESGISNAILYILDKEALVALEDEVDFQRLVVQGPPTVESGFFTATPLNWLGDTKPNEATKPTYIFLNDSSWGAVAEDELTIVDVEVDFDDENNTAINVTGVVLSPYDSYPCSVPGFGFSCIPQPNGNGLDGLPDIIMQRAIYRNFGSYESMVFNFITDVTDGDNLAGIRWTELRKTAGNSWSLYQEGTFAPDDGLDRYMGSIAMDGNGNIGLAYNVSSENEFVGVRFTGRLAGDPLGQMTIEEFNAVTGGSTINSGGRFGDYADMSVDPENDKTFWFTTEYAGPNNVRTRILAFEFQDTNDIAPFTFLSPMSSADLGPNETVTIEYRNLGIDTQQVYQFGYQFEGMTPVVVDIDSTFVPGASYVYEFPGTVDMDENRSYDFKAFTFLDGDDIPGNDTLRTSFTKFNRNDAGVTQLSFKDNSCDTIVNISIRVSNFGADTLRMLTLSSSLNGVLLADINWTGALAQGESEVVDVAQGGFVGGPNDFIAWTNMPNNAIDENFNNDTTAAVINTIANGAAITIAILTDNWPAETTWELLDLDGNEIASGGPYDQQTTLFTQEVCVNPDACYIFTLFDSYGDGIISGGNLIGDYQILNAEGLALANLMNPDFGFEETNTFCANEPCTFDISSDVLAETPAGMDGAIMLSTLSGVGPFEFSIDGGNSFQASSLFSNLTQGTYDVLAISANDCIFEGTVEVGFCDLQVIVNFTDETFAGAMDGTIEIIASSEVDTILGYSIDGGMTFSDASLFENLSPGDYDIIVATSSDCEYNDMVTISMTTNLTDQRVGFICTIFPNPTFGLFNMEVTGDVGEGHYLHLEVLSEDGKFLHNAKLSKYNHAYVGMVSLMNYPSGNYLIRFESKEITKMYMVVKE